MRIKTGLCTRLLALTLMTNWIFGCSNTSTNQNLDLSKVTTTIENGTVEHPTPNITISISNTQDLGNSIIEYTINQSNTSFLVTGNINETTPQRKEYLAVTPGEHTFTVQLVQDITTRTDTFQSKNGYLWDREKLYTDLLSTYGTSLDLKRETLLVTIENEALQFQTLKVGTTETYILHPTSYKEYIQYKAITSPFLKLIITQPQQTPSEIENLLQ